MDPAALAEAFRLFSQASDELSRAYAGLQGQVAQLTDELAQANGELRRQIDEKARLNERLGMLLDALPAGVVVLGSRGEVVEANPAARALIGEDCIAQSWSALCASHLVFDDVSGQWMAPHHVRIEMNETPLDSAGGRIVLLHDVTEAHRMRVQAARSERLAAMGEMVAGLAHQLRTPLSAALLYAANLGSSVLQGVERERAAQRVVERLQYLEELIRDMLVFARGDIGTRERMSVTDLVAQLVANVEVQAHAKSVALSASQRGAEAQVSVSRADIVGALSNLLDNAIQAVPTGGSVALEVTVDAARVRFAVCDNGPGIAPALQHRLFEPFFTTRAQGTGLGLAIARGVARAHGGELECESQAGQGTVFVLTLPRLTQGESRCEEIHA